MKNSIEIQESYSKPHGISKEQRKDWDFLVEKENLCVVIFFIKKKILLAPTALSKNWRVLIWS